MGDLFARVICFEAGSGGVGDRFRIVDQHVVPRLVAIGLSSVGEVPFVVGLTCRIGRHDYSAIPVTPVSDELADFKLDDWNRLSIFPLDPAGLLNQLVDASHLERVGGIRKLCEDLSQSGPESGESPRHSPLYAG